MAVSGNAAKRALLSSVWLRNVSSTTNPLRASSIDGASVRARERVPNRLSAESHVARVPGTPTATPDETSSGVNLYGLPVAGSMNASCVMPAGAVSRPSIVLTRWVRAS